ncbi:hypothetical protein ABK040_005715 [Willaertia magna]
MASNSKDNSGKFSEFVSLCKDIDDVSAHTEKTKVLKNFLSDFKGDVHLLYKLLFAKENKRKFNLKDKRLVDVCSSAFNQDLDDMIEHMDSKGDVSETLKKYLIKSDHHLDKGVVTLKQVDNFLDELTELTKKEEQVRAFKKFINDNVTGDELKFICRIICKDLKIRAGPKYLLAALHDDAYQSYILTHDLKQIVDAVTSGGDLKNLSMTMQSLVDIDALIKDADSDNEGVEFDMNMSDDESDKKKKPTVASSSKDNKDKKDDKKDDKKSTTKKSADKDDSGDDTDIGENIDDIEEKPEELVDEESDDDSKKKKRKSKAKKIKISTKIKLFHPVKPMLARPSKTYDDVINRCPNGFYSELKYDGERIQIHYDKKNDEIKYFSRNLKDVQEHKIKSVKKYITKAIKDKVESVILDGEILMMDTKLDKILPFGSMGKHVRQDHQDAVTCIFLFDILYYNGKSLLSVPLYKRKALMSKIVNPIKHRVMLGEYLVVKGPKQTREAIVASEMNAMIKKGEEGLVFKDLCSPYEPNARHWLKMKKDYLKGMADSVDLVVLGAYLGTGNKGGLMSVFMMGSFDKKIGKWRIICKCGNGHDDATIEALNQELKPNMERISKNPALVPDDIDIHTNALVPDFIVKDISKSVVWEIQGAEFSVSTRTERPISVRFPRVTKIRDDKDVSDHTNYQEIIKLKNESNRKTLVPVFGGGNDSDDDSKDKKKRSRSKKVDNSDDEDEDDNKKSGTKKKGSSRKKKNDSDDKEDEDNSKKSKDVKNSSSDDEDDTKLKKTKTAIGTKLNDIETLSDSSTPENVYYIYGDFMKIPMNKEEKFIAHCVDDSSRWSDKGSMGNIQMLFGEEIKKAYIDDMNTIGDVKVVTSSSNHLCNIVCLQFIQKGRPSKVDYHALDECLKKCATYIKQKKISSFHLYRLHRDISGLDWNKVEQSLKENLSNKGISVFVYTKDRDDKDRVTESKEKLKNRSSVTNESTSDKMDTTDDVAPVVTNDNTSQPNNIFKNVVALISGYTNSENEAITKFITSNGGTVTNNWNIIGNANTHLICESDTEDFKHCSNLGALIVNKYWVFECATKGALLDTLPYIYPASNISTTKEKVQSSTTTAPSKMDLATLSDLFTEMTIYIHNDVPDIKLHKRYIVAYDGIVESTFSDEITHIITTSSKVTPDLSKLLKENPQVHIVSPQWVWHSINSGTLIDWRLYSIK